MGKPDTMRERDEYIWPRLAAIKLTGWDTDSRATAPHHLVEQCHLENSHSRVKKSNFTPQLSRVRLTPSSLYDTLRRYTVPHSPAAVTQLTPPWICWHGTGVLMARSISLMLHVPAPRALKRHPFSRLFFLFSLGCLRIVAKPF